MRQRDEHQPSGSALSQLKQTLGPRKLAHSLLYPLGLPAAVGLGVLGTPATASAGVVHVTPGSPIVVGDDDSVGWDIDQDLTADMNLFDSQSGICSRSYCLSSSGAGAGFAENGSGHFLALTAGSTVGPADSFRHIDCSDLYDSDCNRSGYGGFSLFSRVDNGSPTDGCGTNYDIDGIIGFQFDNGGTTNYGVARFSVRGFDDQDPLGTFTITEWAYDNMGNPISAAALAVPEPSTFVLGALGGLALGATALRRRRKERIDASCN